MMTKTTIYQNQTGLLIRDGRVEQVLESGVYRTYAFRNEAIVVYPTYAQSYAYSIAIRTVEAAAVSVDLSVGITITDAKQLYLSGKSVYEIVNHAVARQLQAVAESKSLAALLEDGLAVDEPALLSGIAEFGLQANIELLPQIRLPRNLQNAIDAQEVARQRAKAELEEARGRSAVIRHYANVAKVTKDNPDLLRLLLGQKAKSINVAFDATERHTK
jgi:regulator of protease activity HflC (stomatin/prohibitin superfamily)